MIGSAVLDDEQWASISSFVEQLRVAPLPSTVEELGELMRSFDQLGSQLPGTRSLQPTSWIVFEGRFALELSNATARMHDDPPFTLPTQDEYYGPAWIAAAIQGTIGALDLCLTRQLADPEELVDSPGTLWRSDEARAVADAVLQTRPTTAGEVYPLLLAAIRLRSLANESGDATDRWLLTTVVEGLAQLVLLDGPATPLPDDWTGQVKADSAQRILHLLLDARGPVEAPPFTLAFPPAPPAPAVAFPLLHHAVLAAIRELASESEQRYWSDDLHNGLDRCTEVLFDDTGVFPWPDQVVGTVLLPEELVPVDAVASALQPLCDDLGDAVDSAYVAHRGWPEVIRAAQIAVRALEAPYVR